MAISFPQNPTIGDTYVVGQNTFVFDGALWTLGATAGTTFNVQLNTSITDTAPSDPNPGDIWLNATTGQGLVYFDDGDTQQWVDIGQPGPQGARGYTGSAGSAGTTGFTGSQGQGADISVYDSNADSTGFFNIPVGTEIQRPETPTNGDMRVNTDGGKLEIYYEGSWTTIKILGFDLSIASAEPITSGIYTYYEFFTPGSYSFTVQGSGDVTVLAVGGGGGGGGADSSQTGGGGGGGGSVLTTLTLTTGDYTVYVGGGGGGGGSNVAGSGGGTAGINGGGTGGNAGGSGSSGAGGGGGGWSGIYKQETDSYLAIAGGGAGGGGGGEGSANETTSNGGGLGSQRTDSVMTGSNGNNYGGDGGGGGAGGGGFPGGVGYGGGGNYVASGSGTINEGQSSVGSATTGGISGAFILGSYNSDDLTWGKGGNANSGAGTAGAVILRISNS